MTQKCDRNCFSCELPDCIADDITIAERSAAIKRDRDVAVSRASNPDNEKERRARLAARQHQFYLENKERILAQKKEYYAANRERVLLCRKRYWQEHGAELNEKRRGKTYNPRGRAYYLAHRDELLAKQREKRRKAKEAKGGNL